MLVGVFFVAFVLYWVLAFFIKQKGQEFEEAGAAAAAPVA